MSTDAQKDSGKKRSAKQQQRLLEEITELFEHKITFNEFLGFRIDRLSPSPVQIRFDMKPDLIGHYLYGRLHGGVISSVLDVAGGLAIMMGIADKNNGDTVFEVMNRFRNLATIDMRVDYLRQGIGEHFIAEAELVRLGSRVAVSSMRLVNDQNTLIATGTASYIVS